MTLPWFSKLATALVNSASAARPWTGRKRLLLGMVTRSRLAGLVAPTGRSLAKKETREEFDHEQTVHCHDYAPAAGIAVGLCWSNLINAQPAAYSTKQVFMTDLANLPGQEVLIFNSDWQPGFKLPLHIHPDGHEFVFVIDGEQTFEVEGTGTKIVTAGGVLYTPPNVPHFGRNATGKLAKTVVFRIKPKDKPITEEVKR